MSIADYHKNLKKKSGMQRSVPQASDWPNRHRQKVMTGELMIMSHDEVLFFKLTLYRPYSLL